MINQPNPQNELKYVVLDIYQNINEGFHVVEIQVMLLYFRLLIEWRIAKWKVKTKRKAKKDAWMIKKNRSEAKMKIIKMICRDIDEDKVILVIPRSTYAACMKEMMEQEEN